jgi:hypothetical protein
MVFVVKSDTKPNFPCIYSHKSPFHILGFEKMLILYPRNQSILGSKVGYFGIFGEPGSNKGGIKSKFQKKVL